MQKCRICAGDVLPYQSYHVDAWGIVHMLCEWGRTPLVKKEWKKQDADTTLYDWSERIEAVRREQP